MSDEQMKAELERLRNENAALKKWEPSTCIRTLIAAERSGRRARLIELDPKYVDVIVQRWQQQTGGHGQARRL